ncbi:putative transketolase, thiamine diphosphate binding domain [Lyophyllum shimeji]|uniref:Transketolase, thiamine diphosphate binding domain n=1 Tax=Lyophyllum shimeji TaxID=47721 RepID=A0A9P3UTR7_LYOSH|nr:putative transketolase, thiamine diphosphate binding domain [Lyophyllum shimeji]
MTTVPLPEFPIDLSKFDTKFALDPAKPTLSKDERTKLRANIQLFRDAIVFFTATGQARGLTGHTGGAYDTAPEVCMILAMFNHSQKRFYPVIFDEAGHRVATQYLLAVLEGYLPAEHLLHYREANSKLPGHPELGLTPGIKFSSGRLGHMWAMVNGVSLANRDKVVFCLGSDGSQQEGNDAEAARIAVAKELNVKVVIDNNDVTIAGHPSEYLPGFDVARTLEGHGLKVIRAEGEDFDAVWEGLCSAVAYSGPAALVLQRKMAPGVPDIEGSPKGHEVISIKGAVDYLQARGYGDLSHIYDSIKPHPQPYLHIGCTKEVASTRVVFGEAVNEVLNGMSKDEAQKRVMVIDSDLEGSTGLKAIHQKHPEVFQPSGVMERGNFSAAAGFGFDKDKFGVFSTFSAFLEMTISEITMARFNNCNVLCHFSHSGVDEADNTCHFGINSMFADSGLGDIQSFLYFPADAGQMVAIIKRIFFERSMRFVFSTRSKVPYVLRPDGSRFFDPAAGYVFTPGRDEVLQEGSAGYVVTFGEMVYRAWDAVLRCRQEGLDVGLVNKPTLNVVDEQTMMMIGRSPFILVVESFNQKTGLGSKFGTWLLERHLTPKYSYMGATKMGCGGLWEQIPHQGLDPQSIIMRIKRLAH